MGKSASIRMKWPLDTEDGAAARSGSSWASSSRQQSSAPPPLAGPYSAMSGHLWRGMSRADVKEFGDIIDAGQAALVIVGESTIEAALEKAGLKAEKHAAKELDVARKTSTRLFKRQRPSSADHGTRHQCHSNTPAATN